MEKGGVVPGMATGKTAGRGREDRGQRKKALHPSLPHRSHTHIISTTQVPVALKVVLVFKIKLRQLLEGAKRSFYLEGLIKHPFS